MDESKDFTVIVTVTFHKSVKFAPMERETPLTKDDALANFYGYGLSEVLDSGEYAYGIDSISIINDEEEGN